MGLRPDRNTTNAAQSTIEMTLLLTVVAVALTTFFSFIRASVSSRLKVGADTFGHGLLHNGN